MTTTIKPNPGAALTTAVTQAVSREEKLIEAVNSLMKLVKEKNKEIAQLTQDNLSLKGQLEELQKVTEAATGTLNTTNEVSDKALQDVNKFLKSLN